MIEPTNPDFSMSRQCRLLGLARSSYYRQLKPESTENLALMKAIDKTHTDHPFFGARQLVRFLGDDGWVVNRKRVRRLMALMGLMAAGQVGQPPAAKGMDFQYTMTTLGRLIEPEQFADVIIKTGDDGQIVRLGDVGRVELGAKNQDINSYLDGRIGGSA